MSLLPVLPQHLCLDNALCEAVLYPYLETNPSWSVDWIVILDARDKLEMEE